MDEGARRLLAAHHAPSTREKLSTTVLLDLRAGELFFVNGDGAEFIRILTRRGQVSLAIAEMASGSGAGMSKPDQRLAPVIDKLTACKALKGDHLRHRLVLVECHRPELAHNGSSPAAPTSTLEIEDADLAHPHHDPNAATDSDSLPIRDRLLGSFVLGGVAVCLRLVPLDLIALGIDAGKRRLSSRVTELGEAERAWVAVTHSFMSAIVHPSCLQRSLAVAVVLMLQRKPVTWCLGVKVSPFQSHAWIELDGQPFREPLCLPATFEVLLCV